MSKVCHAFWLVLVLTIPPGCSSLARPRGPRAPDVAKLDVARPAISPTAATSTVSDEEPAKSARGTVAYVSDAESDERLAAAESDDLRSVLEELKTHHPERFAELSAALQATQRELAPQKRQFLEDQLFALSQSAQSGGNSAAGRLESRSGDVAARLPAEPDAFPRAAARRLEPAPPGGEVGGPVRSGLDAAVQPAGYDGELPPQTAASPQTTNAQPSPSAAVNVLRPTASGLSDRVPSAVAPELDQGDAASGGGDQPVTEQLGAAEVFREWRHTLNEVVRGLESELAEPDRDEEDRRRLETYLRLLYLIDNRQSEAVEPIPGLGEDEQEYWKHQLYSLATALDSDERHAASRRAALALRELRIASNYLANISTLDVRNVALCQQVNSFGDFVEFKPYTFRAGAEVLLYVEIENFAVEEHGRQFETELQGEYTIADDVGQQHASVVLPLDKQICKNRRRDYFIAYRLFLPDDLRAGEYTLKLTIEDLKGKKSNHASVGFRIR